MSDIRYLDGLLALLDSMPGDSPILLAAIGSAWSHFKLKNAMRQPAPLVPGAEVPRCPTMGCGVGVLRPKCFLELNPEDCPRHDIARDFMAQRIKTAGGSST